MEPETAASVVPPGSQNKVIGSPDALSVCSDVRGEDPNHYTAGADSGVEDDDNLSVTHGDDGSEQKTGFQNNLGRKFSADVSLEKMLMSAAAKAKKLAKEKPLRRVSLPVRSKSVDHAGQHSLETCMSLDLSESEGLGLNARRLSDLNAEVGAVGFDVQGTGTWQELPGTEQAGGLLLVKKISNTSASHSDDSESRLSGAETPPVPEEERWVLCTVALVASNEMMALIGCGMTMKAVLTNHVLVYRAESCQVWRQNRSPRQFGYSREERGNNIEKASSVKMGGGGAGWAGLILLTVLIVLPNLGKKNQEQRTKRRRKRK